MKLTEASRRLNMIRGRGCGWRGVAAAVVRRVLYFDRVYLRLHVAEVMQYGRWNQTHISAAVRSHPFFSYSLAQFAHARRKESKFHLDTFQEKQIFLIAALNVCARNALHRCAMYWNFHVLKEKTERAREYIYIYTYANASLFLIGVKEGSFFFCLAIELITCFSRQCKFL